MYDFVKVTAYDGVHYLRKHLIKSISHYKQTMYFHNAEDPVDVKTKLLYDNGDTFYFTHDIETVVETLKGVW